MNHADPTLSISAGYARGNAVLIGGEMLPMGGRIEMLGYSLVPERPKALGGTNAPFAQDFQRQLIGECL